MSRFLQGICPERLAAILYDMELEISGTHLIDNTWQDAARVRVELCEAMRELIRRAYEAGYSEWNEV